MYRRTGFAGGYEDYRQQVAGEYDGQFYSVTFSGNGFTSPSTARQFFLARAGELALNSGYDFFTILDQRDLTTFQTHLTSRTNYSSSSSYTTTSVYNIRVVGRAPLLPICVSGLARSSLPTTPTRYP